MHKRDIVSSLFFLFLGTFFLVNSFRYSIWAGFSPGPGFFPLTFGILLTLLSLLLLLDRIGRQRRRGARAIAFTEIPQFPQARAIAIYFGCCLGVYLLIEFLGYLVTIFLFLLAALPLAGQKSAGAVIVTACMTSIGIYALFVALDVPLPPVPFEMAASLWR